MGSLSWKINILYLCDKITSGAYWLPSSLLLLADRKMPQKFLFETWFFFLFFCLFFFIENIEQFSFMFGSSKIKRDVNLARDSFVQSIVIG